MEKSQLTTEEKYFKFLSYLSKRQRGWSSMNKVIRKHKLSNVIKNSLQKLRLVENNNGTWKWTGKKADAELAGKVLSEVNKYIVSHTRSRKTINKKTKKISELKLETIVDKNFHKKTNLLREDVKAGKSIPIPSARGGRKPIYDFDQFTQMGATLFFEGKDINSVRNAAHSWRKRHNKDYHFACRVVTENGKEGVRIWRVEENSKLNKKTAINFKQSSNFIIKTVKQKTQTKTPNTMKKSSASTEEKYFKFLNYLYQRERGFPSLAKVLAKHKMAAGVGFIVKRDGIMEKKNGMWKWVGEKPDAIMAAQVLTDANNYVNRKQKTSVIVGTKNTKRVTAPHIAYSTNKEIIDLSALKEEKAKLLERVNKIDTFLEVAENF